MSTPNAMNNQPGYGPPMSQQQPQGPPPQGPPAPQGYPVQQPPMMSQPSQAPPGMSQGQQMPPQQPMMQQSQAGSANMMGGPSGGPPPSSQPMGSRAMPPPNAYRRSPSQGRLNMQGEKIFPGSDTLQYFFFLFLRVLPLMFFFFLFFFFFVFFGFLLFFFFLPSDASLFPCALMSLTSLLHYSAGLVFLSVNFYMVGENSLSMQSHPLNGVGSSMTSTDTTFFWLHIQL